MQLEELAARLSAEFSAEDRAKLIAALLAAQPAQVAPPPAVAAAEPPPANEKITGSVTEAGPLLTPDTPAQAEDTPEDRARLLAILMANPSGLSPYALLDSYKIPPSTLEFAIRDGQATPRAERGIGLTHEYGGAWARHDPKIDEAALRQMQAQFEARLREAVNG